MKRDTVYLQHTQYWVDVISQRVATQLRLSPGLACRYAVLERVELRREIALTQQKRQRCLTEKAEDAIHAARLKRLVRQCDERLVFLREEDRSLGLTQRRLSKV